MDKILFSQTYDTKDLQQYDCKTVQQLEDKIVKQLREKYSKEIITISENNDNIVVNVEKSMFI